MFYFCKKKGNSDIYCYDTFPLNRAYLDAKIISNFQVTNLNNSILQISHFSVVKEDGLDNVSSCIYQFKHELGIFTGVSLDAWRELEFNSTTIEQLQEILEIKKLLRL